MTLYSFPQYFHKPLYFKLYFINILCVCWFSLFLSLKDVFLSHQFGSSISESLTIHRCAFVEKEWKGAHYILFGSFSPSIFNNSMTVWQQKLVPICPLWQRVYHYGVLKPVIQPPMIISSCISNLFGKRYCLGYRQTW